MASKAPEAKTEDIIETASLTKFGTVVEVSRSKERVLAVTSTNLVLGPWIEARRDAKENKSVLASFEPKIKSESVLC